MKYPPHTFVESPGHFISHEPSEVLEDSGGALSPQKHSDLKDVLYLCTFGLIPQIIKIINLEFTFKEKANI